MKQLYYKLNENKEPVPCDCIEAAQAMSRNSLACDKIGDAEVSTVFLAIDHNFMPNGPAVLFETMVFGGKRDKDQYRYGTYAEAMEGHRRIVEELRGVDDSMELAE